jgi:hypothetical protein
MKSALEIALLDYDGKHAAVRPATQARVRVKAMR